MWVSPPSRIGESLSRPSLHYQDLIEMVSYLPGFTGPGRDGKGPRTMRRERCQKSRIAET